MVACPRVILQAVLCLTAMCFLQPTLSRAQCDTISFHETAALSIPSSGTEILLAGDLNNDGKTDLVMDRSPYGIQVAMGNGNGSFTPQTPFDIDTASVIGGALGDLNRDGKLDLVVTTPPGMRTYLGRGDGTFHLYTLPAIDPQLPPPPPPQWVDVQLGDIDADGHIDAVVADYRRKGVVVMFGRADGYLGERGSFFETGGLVTGLSIVGRSVATSSLSQQSGDYLRMYDWRRDTGSWFSWGSARMDHGPFKIAVADMDRDGQVDWVISESGDGFLTSVNSYAFNKWQTRASTRISPRMSYIALGDFDLDGKLEVAGTGSDGSISVSRFTKSTGFSQPQIVARGSWPTAVVVEDFNGDGAPDIAFVDKVANQVHVLTNNCGPRLPDLRADAIEIVQTIQDNANSVPLLAGKRTFARLHVRGNAIVFNLDATLWRVDTQGNRIGEELRPINANGSINLPIDPSRQKFDDSFVFELPTSWLAAGTLSLVGEINRSGRVHEVDHANNRITREIELRPNRPLPVTFVRLHWLSKGKPVTVVDAELDEGASELLRKLPIAQLDLRIKDQDFNFDDQGSTWLPITFASQINNWNETFEAGVSRLYYFFMGRGGGSGIGGGAAPALNPRRVAIGEARAIAHEFGHLFGIDHVQASCGNPEGPYAPYPYRDGIIGGPAENAQRFVGFDPGAHPGGLAPWAATRVVPSDVRDIMTYCSDQWFSNWSIDSMLDDIARRFASAKTDRVLLAQADGQLPSGGLAASVDGYTSGDFLTVAGTIDVRSKKLLLWQALRIEQVGTMPATVSGPLKLRLLDSRGGPIAEHAFQPNSTTDDQRFQHFRIVVPFESVAHSIELGDSESGTILARQAISKFAPHVEAVQASLGSWPDRKPAYTLSWKASDADGNPLSYAVLYSQDGGRNWRVMAVGLQSTSYEVPHERIPGTHGEPVGRFRVVATDGILTGHSDSAPLIVSDKPPRVSILSPFPDVTYMQGQLIALQASISDRDEDSVEDNQLVWQSSRDGEVGRGLLAHFVPKSPGLHVISLSATDARGNVGRADRRIFVGDRNTPLVIQCATRKGKNITYGGYEGAGHSWRRSREEVISDIQGGENYYMVADSSTSDVAIVRPPGKAAYLRAPRDTNRSNNLIALPKCVNTS